MDNDTPPEDDLNKPQGSQPPLPEDLEDVDVYEPEEESLGRNKNTTFIIAGGMVVVVSYVLYSIFYTPTEPKNLNPADASGKGSISPQTSEDSPNLDLGADSGSLPSPPQITLQAPPPPIESPIYTPPPIVAPPPVASGTVGTAIGSVPTPTSAKGTVMDEPPPPPPPSPALSVIKSGKSGGAGDENSKKRMHANMLLMDGGGPGEKDQPAASSGANSSDPNMQFQKSADMRTEKVTATQLTNLNMTIAQGKIVYAVLETAINTDLPGTLRAIIARDTYAEAGRTIMIPKGSRLIGTYNTEVKQGQSRVMIVWSRLIRPDGVDIQIGSPGIDGLGRAGVYGDVDNKFAQIFTTSILTSAITLGAAVAADAVLPVQTNQSTTTTTTPEGNQITSATPAQQAAAQAVNDLGGHGKEVVDKMINLAPTITVDQGTLINVFVNKDLTFPSDAGGGELFIH